jgi:hypothetical protein
MFYILTCGSTGSVWVARALSRHPDIVCFHGLKTLPLAPGNDPSKSQARQFVGELAHLYRMSHGDKIFGAIHGFAVAEILPEIAAVGGAFAAMIRHPITRLDSLFHREAHYMGALQPDDVYRSFGENQRYLDDIPSDQSAARPALSDYARKFEELCNSVMIEDTFILERMERRDVFQYEKIVLDREYFRACFERLAEGCRHAVTHNDAMRLDSSWEGFSPAVRLECTQAYLDAVFAMGPVNIKRSGKRSIDDILAIWPDLFKAIFVQHLERQGGRDAVDRYAEYGYKLPDGVHPSSVTGSRAPLTDSSQSRSLMGGLAVPDPGAALARDGSASGPEADALPESLAEAATSGPASGVGPLLAIIEAERTAHAARINELQDTLAAEHDAFVARIRELEGTVDSERAAYGAQIADLRVTFDAERQAAVARIRELEATLKAEHDAFVARIRELERTVDSERAAYGSLIAELQVTFDAERQAAVARIRELEATLKAEQDAFVARIRELEGQEKGSLRRESVSKAREGLQSFLSMRRMQARHMKTTGLWLRFSQALASLRQRSRRPWRRP